MHMHILPNNHSHAYIHTHKCAHILNVSAESGRTDRRHMQLADCEAQYDRKTLSHTLKHSTNYNTHTYRGPFKRICLYFNEEQQRYMGICRTNLVQVHWLGFLRITSSYKIHTYNTSNEVQQQQQLQESFFSLCKEFIYILFLF